MPCRCRRRFIKQMAAPAVGPCIQKYAALGPLQLPLRKQHTKNTTIEEQRTAGWIPVYEPPVKLCKLSVAEPGLLLVVCATNPVELSEASGGIECFTTGWTRSIKTVSSSCAERNASLFCPASSLSPVKTHNPREAVVTKVTHTGSSRLNATTLQVDRGFGILIGAGDCSDMESNRSPK